jgi:SMI1 / KNR4 family (SUKH-1)
LEEGEIIKVKGMKFINSESPITEQDIAHVERIIGLNFPPVIRDFYLSTNGGSPEPYVFENEAIDTVVSEFLPLKSEGKGTALASYEYLVCKKKLVPRHFLPFAIDGGGDYFFTDLLTSDGKVYYFNSDTIDRNPLVSLSLSFKQFWNSLKVEN